MASYFDWRDAMKFLCLPAIASCVLILTGSNRVAYACQQQGQGRDIVSEDFTRNRPTAEESRAASKPGNNRAKTGQNARSKKKRQIYRFVSTQPAIMRAAVTSSTVTKTSAGLATEQVGITIWRLRASTVADSGPKIPVHEGSGTTWWTPERTRAGTLFKIGERVRISIESPRAGYLYVIDREQYADGTLGDPFVIFPTLQARGGDNRVSAGMLIEIPDQGDRIPYFKMTRGRDDQVGEILTVLVAPQPIEGIPITYERPRLSPEQVAQWESIWGAQAELFEIDSGAGAPWTAAEQQAGSISKRSLTQEEPVPQTLYRVLVKPGNPLLVTVPLRYGHANTP